MTMSSGPDRVRLHITPFNSDLLDRYLPPSLKSHATNISFHAIETFPERGFGFVELPAMEAQKLKSKLNGSVLKGAKVKIEEAKPEKKRKVVEEEAEVEVRKKVKKEKRKKEDGVIPGYELEEGRHVKRGWTEDGKGKKKDKDKKMKFKTEVPLNKLPVGKTGKVKEEVKDKDEDEKPRKAKTGKKPAVVKEFSKSVKPNTTGALSGKKGELSYEEGTGWVDAKGNVVEGEPLSKKRTRAKAAAEAAAAKAAPKAEPVQEPSADAESASSSEESSSEESDLESSSEESEASDGEDVVERQLNEAKNNAASNAAAERERQHSTPVPSAEPGAAKEIHPLEALFKRAPPKAEGAAKPQKPSPIDTSFSFFNAGADDDDQPMVENNIPQTPHTRQDLEWRSLRSAAPTPDTAAIGKRFNFDLAAKKDAEDEESADEDVHMQDAGSPQPRAGAKTADKGEKEESEFRKWFYDNRGDLNRGWKKRRREERKVVRQRENRRLSRRVA